MTGALWAFPQQRLPPGNLDWAALFTLAYLAVDANVAEATLAGSRRDYHRPTGHAVQQRIREVVRKYGICIGRQARYCALLAGAM